MQRVSFTTGIINASVISSDSKKLALRIALLVRAKKAQKVVVLDMRHVSGLCDYFVIASGTSLRQCSAFAEAIKDDLNKEGLKPLSPLATNDESGWVVLDFASVVVHVFYQPTREFYALERLWSDAKKVRITKKY